MRRWSRFVGIFTGVTLALLLVTSPVVSGQSAQIQAAIRALLAGNNIWTGTNTFQAITVTSCTGCGGGGGTVTTSAPVSGDGSMGDPITILSSASPTFAGVTLTNNAAIQLPAIVIAYESTQDDGALPPGTYYLKATSVDQYGNESAASNEIGPIVVGAGDNGTIVFSATGPLVTRIYFGSTSGGQTQYADLFYRGQFHDIADAVAGTPPSVSTLINPSLSVFNSSTFGVVPVISAPSGTASNTLANGQSYQATTLLVGDRQILEAWDAEEEFGSWFGYVPFLTVSNFAVNNPGEWYAYGPGALAGDPSDDAVRVITYFANYTDATYSPATGPQGYIGTYDTDVFGFLVNSEAVAYLDDSVDALVLPRFSLQLGNGGALRPDTTTAHGYELQVYDVNGTAMRPWAAVVNGDAPGAALTIPSTGTLTIDATSVSSWFTATGTTPAVANVGADSCGTSAAAIAGENNAGRVTVGATAGTQCRITTTVTAPTAWECTASNTTTAALARCVPVDTTHFDLVGVFTAGDVISYVAFAR